jgi:hypothetical protein
MANRRIDQADGSCGEQAAQAESRIESGKSPAHDDEPCLGAMKGCERSFGNAQ